MQQIGTSITLPEGNTPILSKMQPCKYRPSWQEPQLVLTFLVYRSASSCSLLMSCVAPALDGRTLNLFSSSRSSFSLAFCCLSLSIAALHEAGQHKSMEEASDMMQAGSSRNSRQYEPAVKILEVPHQPRFTL